MRKGLLALGIFLSFVGLGFMAASQIVVKPEPLQNWVDVDKVSVEQPSPVLSVQGPLNQGDKFRVNFQLAPVSSPMISIDASVIINFTDPNGNTTSYDIPVERTPTGVLALSKPFPEDVANFTGTFKVDAEGIWGMSLIYLALEKVELEEKEPQHPYGTFFPVGGAIVLAGSGIFLLGTKNSKHKRRLHKHKSRFFVPKYNFSPCMTPKY